MNSVVTENKSSPRRIGRVAARRVFQKVGKTKRQIVLTIGVPQPMGGLHWGCAVQVTGLDRGSSRPRFVFGVDALQALQLAMQFASVTLETSAEELEWLGEKGDLGLPKLLPNHLPKAQQDRLDRIIDRETARFYAAAKRRANRNAGKTSPAPSRVTYRKNAR